MNGRGNPSHLLHSCLDNGKVHPWLWGRVSEAGEGKDGSGMSRARGRLKWLRWLHGEGSTGDEHTLSVWVTSEMRRPHEPPKPDPGGSEEGGCSQPPGSVSPGSLSGRSCPPSPLGGTEDSVGRDKWNGLVCDIDRRVMWAWQPGSHVLRSFAVGGGAGGHGDPEIGAPSASYPQAPSEMEAGVRGRPPVTAPLVPLELLGAQCHLLCVSKARVSACR